MIMRKWIDSILIVMLVGLFLMAGCCYVAFHYRTQGLLPLYNFGLITGVAVCAYGLAVMSYAAFASKVVTALDVGDLFMALTVFSMCLFGLLPFVGLGGLAVPFWMGTACWLAYIHHYRVERRGKDKTKNG